MLKEGHYYAIVERGNKWYKCNDSIITEHKAYVQEEKKYILFDNIKTDNLYQNGYLFFYRNVISSWKNNDITFLFTFINI